MTEDGIPKELLEEYINTLLVEERRFSLPPHGGSLRCTNTGYGNQKNTIQRVGGFRPPGGWVELGWVAFFCGFSSLFLGGKNRDLGGEKKKANLSAGLVWPEYVCCIDNHVIPTGITIDFLIFTGVNPQRGLGVLVAKMDCAFLPQKKKKNKTKQNKTTKRFPGRG